MAAGEKGLPVNVDAEKALLGAILLDDSRYMQAAASLTVEDFSYEKHRRIFKRMGELQDRGQPIDRITLANILMEYGELESVDGLAYLVTLDDGMPANPHVDGYIAILKDKSLKRRLIFSAQEVMNTCAMDDSPAISILGDARDRLLTLGGTTNAGGPKLPGQIIDAAGGASAFISPKRDGLRTGFAKYDDLTGGLHGGEVTIFAARPSAGKTALALNIAENVALKQGKSVAIFSLEMSQQALLHRLMCSVARVDSQRVRMGYLGQEERRRLAAALERLSEAKLYIDDTTAATATGLHAKVRELLNTSGVDLVIIDYLQLMSAGRTKFESKNQEVADISRGIKLLSMETKRPLLVLSQLSRAVEQRKGDHRPILSDLRDSGAIEMDADNVAFIFREELYDRNREDLRGLAELILAKQRQGPIGTAHLVFIHSQTKFENRAEDVGDDSGQLPL